MHVPSFDLLLKNYPSDPNALHLKRMIGGSIDDTKQPLKDQWLGGATGDTCTIRMSRALNYSGVHISKHLKGVRTAPGADHLQYAFAVQEMRTFLTHSFGQPNINVTKKPVSRDPFSSNKGIILFDIHFGMNRDQRTRALGHVDLWDSKTFFDETTGQSDSTRDFFTIADRVSLWIAQGSSFWQ